MTKAPNGLGSVRPRIDKRGNVTGYFVEMSLGNGPNGKRRRTRRTVKTKKEAEELRARLATAHLDGRLTVVSGNTVRTYGLAWVRDVKAQKVRPTTASDYETRLRTYVFPYLGTVRMVDLRPGHVDAWMAELRRAGKSAKTVNGARQVLNGMCKHAYRTGIIASNPVMATDPVRCQHGERTQVRKAWSTEEVHKVLDAALPHRLDGLLHLMLHTGMRPGEALGLLWEDVDLDARRLRVTGTQKEGRVLLPNGHGLVRPLRNAPKTAASRRELPISDALHDALLRQQMRQSVQKIGAGDRWEEQGYVFTSRCGRPWSLSNIRKEYAALLEANGLRYIRLHDIRHTVAQLALGEGGIPIEMASQALGHTRIDTTKQIYAGHVRRYNDEFVAGISAVLPPPRTQGPQHTLDGKVARHE